MGGCGWFGVVDGSVGPLEWVYVCFGGVEVGFVGGRGVFYAAFN